MTCCSGRSFDSLSSSLNIRAAETVASHGMIDMVERGAAGAPPQGIAATFSMQPSIIVDRAVTTHFDGSAVQPCSVSSFQLASADPDGGRYSRRSVLQTADGRDVHSSSPDVAGRMDVSLDRSHPASSSSVPVRSSSSSILLRLTGFTHCA